jgi:hypothetical protein
VRAVDPKIVDGKVARVLRVEAEAVVLCPGDVAVFVRKQEEVLLTGDQSAADVLDEAEDIRQVLPLLAFRWRVG